MQPSNLSKFFLRILGAWFVASMLGIFFGEAVFEALIPLLEFVIGHAQSDFIPHLDIYNHGGTKVLRMTVSLAKPLILTPNITAPGGPIQGSIITNLDHCMVPLVILTTSLIGWPIHSGIRETVLRLICGLGGCLTVIFLTTPLFLVARVQMVFIKYLMRTNEHPEQPFLITWAIFTESGGRWLIPIVLSAVSIILARNVSIRLASAVVPEKPSSTIRI